MIGIHSIEDCLEIITGLQKHNLEFKIDSSDATIMNSIARQVFKGTALTDRQYNLMKEKLQKYKEQFESQDVIDFDEALGKLRNPLRKIDRSKYIRLVESPADMLYNESEQDSFIEVRFPFKKSDIMLINEISNTNTYFHKKGTHSHYFSFNERNVINVLDRFLNKEFEIDKEIKEAYINSKNIQDNKLDFLNGVREDTLFNINPTLLEIIKQEVNIDDNIKLNDRKFRYGFNVYETKEPNNLIEKIAYRKDTSITLKPSEHTTNEVLSSLWELDRFPMLVILDKKDSEEQLYEMVNYYRDILPSECQSVLFRLEDSSSSFNQLVKDRRLNNWVDKQTKIVYISADKLPKVLLNADWTPITVYSYYSRHSSTVESYVKNKCDLVVYREEDVSPFRRYSSYYGYM